MSEEGERGDFRAVDAVFVLVLAFLLMIGFSQVLPSPAPMLALPAAAILGATIRRRTLTTLFAAGHLTPGIAAWTVAGTAGLLVVLQGLEPLMELFPRKYMPELMELTNEILAMPWPVAVLILSVLAPICEEMLFRGALLKGFRASWGTFAGVAVSSVLFGTVHGIPPRMVATFLLGLWFAGLAVRTGGVAAPILAHAVNNGLVLAILHSRWERVPILLILPAGAALIFSILRLFRPPALTVQGSGPPGAS